MVSRFRGGSVGLFNIDAVGDCFRVFFVYVGFSFLIFLGWVWSVRKGRL